MSNLKPCPFCGSEASLHDGATKDACCCTNSKCLLFARLLYIPLWNARPFEDKQAEQIERLKSENQWLTELNRLLISESNQIMAAIDATNAKMKVVQPQKGEE